MAPSSGEESNGIHQACHPRAPRNVRRYPLVPALVFACRFISFIPQRPVTQCARLRVKCYSYSVLGGC